MLASLNHVLGVRSITRLRGADMKGLMNAVAAGMQKNGLAIEQNLLRQTHYHNLIFCSLASLRARLTQSRTWCTLNRSSARRGYERTHECRDCRMHTSDAHRLSDLLKSCTVRALDKRSASNV